MPSRPAVPPRDHSDAEPAGIDPADRDGSPLATSPGSAPVTGQALSELFHHDLQPTLLHPRLATTVTGVSTLTRLSIRALATVVETSLEMARHTTVATMGTPEFLLNTILSIVRFLQDQSARLPLSGVAQGLWQFSRATLAQLLPAGVTHLVQMIEHGTSVGAYVVSSTYSLAEQFTQAGFELATATTTMGLRGAEESVRLIDALFGSTETSRAVSAIVDLIRKEIYDDSDFTRLSSRAGHLVAFSSLVKALTAFACLQCVTVARTATRYRLALIRRCVLDTDADTPPDTAITPSVVTPYADACTLAESHDPVTYSPTRSEERPLPHVELGHMRETSFVEGQPVVRDTRTSSARSDTDGTDPDLGSPGTDSDLGQSPESVLRDLEHSLVAHLRARDSRPISPAGSAPVSDDEWFSDNDASPAVRAYLSPPGSPCPLARTHTANPVPQHRPHSLPVQPVAKRSKSLGQLGHPEPFLTSKLTSSNHSHRRHPSASNLFAVYYPLPLQSVPPTAPMAPLGPTPPPLPPRPSPPALPARPPPPVTPLPASPSPMVDTTTPIQAFPRAPLLDNIARFIRYSSAAYGDRFMRIFGIKRRAAAKRQALRQRRARRDTLDDRTIAHAGSRGSPAPHPPRSRPGRRRSFQHHHPILSRSKRTTAPGTPRQRPHWFDHANHKAFATHIDLPLESILYSSYTNLASLYDAHVKHHRSVDRPPAPLGLLATLTQTVGPQLPKPSIHALVHYISVDHDLGVLVLTCRGTLGLSDILTDLFFHYAEFDLPYPDVTPPGAAPRHYRTHAGMLQSARLLAETNSPVFRELREAMLKYPTYGLVFSGHSLGGGVAAVLAILWSRAELRTPQAVAGSDAGYLAQLRATLTSENCPIFTERDTETVLSVDPPVAHPGEVAATPRIRWFVTSEASGLPPGRPIHCIAYGVPCVGSLDLAIYCRGLITSVANAHDVVPHLSLGLLHDFKNVAATLASEKEPLAERIVQRVLRTLVREKRVEHTKQFKDLTVRSQRYVSARKQQQQRAQQPPPDDHVASPSSSPQSTSPTAKTAPVVKSSTSLIRPSIPMGEYDDWFWSLIQTMRASMTTEKLYPPGDVYILDSTQPKVVRLASSERPVVPTSGTSWSSPPVYTDRSGGRTNAAGGGGDDDLTATTPADSPRKGAAGSEDLPHRRRYMSLYRCLDVTTRFSELKFSRHMFTEHSPKYYEDHINVLLRGVPEDTSS
ncbi:hypothetical protein IWQ60_000802 [Tieghemiomyces parasiticus]|uniref:sn-1-specific diacylglycerol lipase n=1 Tax=Tieghemiomyces parasiticus TaxID=78921 RepID=A0A9W8AKF3_9FUNG|nr:hypothetical protein IWQ60_000802 [Tieghemiomyces parasiticus]